MRCAIQGGLHALMRPGLNARQLGGPLVSPVRALKSAACALSLGSHASGGVGSPSPPRRGQLRWYAS